MTRFTLYTSEYLGENNDGFEDELQNHKELIILLESVRYCQIKNVDRLRYSELRRLSNKRLADLTGGTDVDFGGSFEHNICRFEGVYNGFDAVVKRIKDNGKSFIIPNIEKIGHLFDNLKLGDLFREKALIKDPIFIDYENSYSPADSMDITREGRLMDLIYPPGVYTARYYYKDGHPIFLRQLNSDESNFGFNKSEDPSPFYQKNNYLYKVANSPKDDIIFKSNRIELHASTTNGMIRLSEVDRHYWKQERKLEMRLHPEV